MHLLPVTVLVPYFNSSKHVASVFDTIRQQIARPSHVVLYDDGSSDGSFDVVEGLAGRLRESGMEVINVRSAVNRGRGAARQELLGHAATDYVAWLDVDDTWPPSKLLSQWMKFVALGMPDDLILYGNYLMVSSWGGARSLVRYPQQMTLSRLVGFDAGPRSLQLQTTMGRVAAFSSVGFDPLLNWSEDFDFALRFLYSGGRLINFVSHNSYYGATYNNSAPSNWEEIRANHRRVYQKNGEIFSSAGVSVDEFALHKELRYTSLAYAEAREIEMIEDLLRRADPYRDDPRFSAAVGRCIERLWLLKNDPGIEKAAGSGGACVGRPKSIQL